MHRACVLSLIAILTTLVGNVLPFLIWLPLWAIPPGIAIRPMGDASLSFITLLATIGLGLPVGRSLLSIGRRTSGWLCVLFSVSPVFMSWTIFEWICAVHHLTWAD